MEFWENDLKSSSCLCFKILIIILEYSDAIKKQKEGEKEKGKETENSIEKAKITSSHRGIVHYFLSVLFLIIIKII